MITLTYTFENQKDLIAFLVKNDIGEIQVKEAEIAQAKIAAPIKELTYDDLVDAMKKLSKVKGIKAAAQIAKDFGFSSISEFKDKPLKWAEVIAACGV